MGSSFEFRFVLTYLLPFSIFIFTQKNFSVRLLDSNHLSQLVKCATVHFFRKHIRKFASRHKQSDDHLGLFSKNGFTN